MNDIEIMPNDTTGSIVLRSPSGLKPGGIATSLDMTNAANMMKVFRARQNADKDIKDLINTEVTITDFLAYYAEVNDEKEGGLIEFVRYVFFCEDGSTFSTGSVGIGRDFQMLLAMIGPMPWNPGLKVRIRSVPCSGTRQIYQLQPDEKSFIAACKKKVVK